MQRTFSLRLAGATAGLLLTATSSFAAEPLPPPPPPPVFSWTGVDLGVDVGGAVGQTSVQLLDFSNTYNFSGAFGGLFVGYNYQLETWPIVAGLQLEYNFTGITGSTSNALLNFERTAVRQFGGADGRLGLAFDRLLVYAIGGFAYGDIRGQILCGNILCGPFIPPNLVTGRPGVAVTRDFAANRYGFDVGGGLEYNLWGNWMVRAEYRFYDWRSLGFNDAGFGAFVFPFNARFGFSNPFAIAIPNHRDSEIMHTGRIGLSYKFAWPPAPVVAKY
ncbi:MAG: porin family protein [Methylocapsa sp.]|nr:porin family protein [Methylocapsa sp.]